MREGGREGERGGERKEAIRLREWFNKSANNINEEDQYSVSFVEA